MRRILYILLALASVAAVAAYFVFAHRLSHQNREQTMVRSVEVRLDSASDGEGLLSEESVLEILNRKGFAFDSLSMASLNTAAIEDSLEVHPFVKEVRVYSSMDGRLTIELSQRRPIARYLDNTGGGFYISDDHWILPVGIGTPQYVPVITGRLNLPLEPGFYGELPHGYVEGEKKYDDSYRFLFKLINFVEVISSDPFWNAQIVQIEVDNKGGGAMDPDSRQREPELILVPRAGNYLVLFGSADRVEEKLRKLLLFYRKMLDYEGWDAYSTINLKYRDQVVCRR